MKDVNVENAFKICATCRYLKAIETGREFERIIDTEYTRFTCKILGWEKKEFYLMAPIQKNLDELDFTPCEFWEEWIPPNQDVT